MPFLFSMFSHLKTQTRAVCVYLIHVSWCLVTFISWYDNRAWTEKEKKNTHSNRYTFLFASLITNINYLDDQLSDCLSLISTSVCGFRGILLHRLKTICWFILHTVIETRRVQIGMLLINKRSRLHFIQSVSCIGTLQLLHTHTWLKCAVQKFRVFKHFFWICFHIFHWFLNTTSGWIVETNEFYRRKNRPRNCHKKQFIKTFFYLILCTMFQWFVFFFLASLQIIYTQSERETSTIVNRI